MLLNGRHLDTVRWQHKAFKRAEAFHLKVTADESADMQITQLRPCYLHQRSPRTGAAVWTLLTPLRFLTRAAARCPRHNPVARGYWHCPPANPRCTGRPTFPAQQSLQHPPVKMGSKNKVMKHQEPGTNLSFKRSVAIIFAQFHNQSADFLVLITAVSVSAETADSWARAEHFLDFHLAQLCSLQLFPHSSTLQGGRYGDAMPFSVLWSDSSWRAASLSLHKCIQQAPRLAAEAKNAHVSRMPCRRERRVWHRNSAHYKRNNFFIQRKINEGVNCSSSGIIKTNPTRELQQAWVDAESLLAPSENASKLWNILLIWF